MSVHIYCPAAVSYILNHPKVIGKSPHALPVLFLGLRKKNTLRMDLGLGATSAPRQAQKKNGNNSSNDTQKLMKVMAKVLLSVALQQRNVSAIVLDTYRIGSSSRFVAAVADAITKYKQKT